MPGFESAYHSLNTAQRQAVDSIDGPLLVIAGPGTGKTQLLSARVANILHKTDTLAQNILCLTFTENGAENMRERLTRFIGQSAYNVTISTYHGLGSEIIHRFPQYFTATQLQNPVDQLGKHEILRQIVDALSYASPLKQLRHHIGDLVTTVSEIKRALLTPDDLRAIAAENHSFIAAANSHAHDQLSALSTQGRITKQSVPHFEKILDHLSKLVPIHPVHQHFGSLCLLASDSLRSALTDAETLGKTTPLTAWKNTWLAKDESNQYVFAGTLENQRMAALADVFEEYESALAKQGLYDFDDMIARTIEAMERHPDLKYTLQEQYLYILLDEFQDTNAAQLRLVELLTDNPIHEGKPNIMAVGDDDQAIYAFQGAQYSNMLDYYHLYRDVTVINLTENYRSHADIIDTAEHVADQIDMRLHHRFPGLTKLLSSAGKTPHSATILRQELSSDVAQYNWIATRIKQLIEDGTPPKEIAVLAPKHRYLEPLVAYLNEQAIPVQYEKRENVLESPLIKQLLTMCRLVLALHHGRITVANALWPEVLSYDFWQIPTQVIWEQSWRISDDRTQEPNWLRSLLDSTECQTPALLFATLALKTQTETCEMMIDYLIGTAALQVKHTTTTSITSPLRAYYTSQAMQNEKPELFYETIVELKVLQTKLREHQRATGRTLMLEDLVSFVEMYEAAGEQLLNTSPYHQQANAVQLMTVFKAKGLEFEHVFLPSCHDDVWGKGSRASNNTLTLPSNLAPIRHAGATDDERLRLLFVAITRARSGLYLTSYAHTFSGKQTKRLKYLDEQEQEDGSFLATILPPSSQRVHIDDSDAPTLQTLELDWHTRHYSNVMHSNLRDMLAQRLRTYQLSPTHLNQFVDLEHNGPLAFMFNTLLRFPQAPSASGQYGNAIHETLEWLQHRFTETHSLPDELTTLARFREYMHAKQLSDHERALFVERGEKNLRSWLRQRGNIFQTTDITEHNFKHEGVFIKDTHLTGKVDRMEIDRQNKHIVVVDYKTGKPHQHWKPTTLGLHKYRQQLYFYKLLIEGSHTYAGYTVTAGRLEFIEPDEQGRCHALDVIFDAHELAQTRRLIQAVWRHITTLDLPNTVDYPQNLKGSIEFESALLDEITEP